MKKYIILLFILFPFLSKAQSVSGVVFRHEANGKQPLPGVNVVWEGTSEGTASMPDGSFTLKHKPGRNKLVFSFVGYESQTIGRSESDSKGSGNLFVGD